MKSFSLRRGLVPSVVTLALAATLAACGSDDDDGGDDTEAATASVDCLTVEQVVELWKPGSEITNWSQLDDSFPDQEINLFGPGTDSGTYDYMASEIVDPDAEEPATRDDYEASEDDNVLVDGVAGTEGATGYFGYTYYEQNKDRLAAVSIDSGDGCVAPSAETAQDGTYTPLARPLFIYVNKANYTDNEAVQEYVDFYINNLADIAEAGQFVPLSEELYAETQSALEELGGSGAEGSSGDVKVDGSSTVYPMSVLAQEGLAEVNPDVKVTVGEAGTGGGFELFCAGETDVSDASRPIDEEEIAACEAEGVEYVELQVATDALTIVVNPDL
ncbi:substrate-binding domain-containing protein [Nocardioides bizhenqiangii]|uniref:Substrate-binding domain-containing protein n=1 Tax=Nocardioides bizhenqiangii TaxID=3095076 RepID=A0ABZ0ZP63_9ACTN|nr:MULTISPECIES: substrate-binding domain-containing protein [unclassified Nocardioides]MDZ5619980.1 substrate-binding domain-containing protein [Nocardioides sp. HM23]WQQ26017.1 substrate-binding domain-containing protein [Nocardioides sp. HM61]